MEPGIAPLTTTASATSSVGMVNRECVDTKGRAYVRQLVQQMELHVDERQVQPYEDLLIVVNPWQLVVKQPYVEKSNGALLSHHSHSLEDQEIKLPHHMSINY